MGTSGSLVDMLIDTLTEFVNVDDETKKLGLDLSGATPSTKMTLVSSQTEDRTLNLPDKDGTLQTVEMARAAVTCQCLDFLVDEIATLTLPNNTTLTIDNPVQGKTVLLELTPAGYDLILPATCKVLAGRYDSNQKNYIYFHCVDAAAPTYLVTHSQQIA